MIEARNIHFTYHRRAVLEEAALALGPGELVCLLGANGAGKSTLLKIMQGLLKPQQGNVTLDGRPLSGMSRRQLARSIAYVPQVHAAPFPYTVREVALLGRLPANGIFRAPDTKDCAMVDAALEHLSIAHLARRPYTEISGGERQLALIARALVQEARYLVMDEPFAGLDYGHQVRLLAGLKNLAAEGYGVLLTTHDPDQPLTGCQRVALLIDRRIVVDGPPETALTPEAIHQLYGVQVDLLRTADHRAIAFRPKERRVACFP